MEAERSESLAGLVDLAPEIVAGKADMLPAQRGDMGEQFSDDDYAAGPGYLVGGEGLYHQAGKGTARAVP